MIPEPRFHDINNKYVREKGNFTDYPRYSLNLNSLDTSFSFMLIDIVRRN